MCAFAEFERSIRQRVRVGLNVIKEKLAQGGKFTSKKGEVCTAEGRKIVIHKGLSQ
jgi:hypothetical protein